MRTFDSCRGHSRLISKKWPDCRNSYRVASAPAPGDVYKPSAIRSYEAALRDHIVLRVGPTRLGDVQHRDVQRIADDLLAQGRDPSTIRNALMPLRVIFRRTVEDGDLAVNPCTHLRLHLYRR